MLDMAEDIFGEGHADFGDDFSIASGFDEISYDDLFNSHQHDSDSSGFRSSKNEIITPQDPIFQSKIRGMGDCPYNTSSRHGDIGKVADKCDLKAPFQTGSSVLPSLDSPMKPNRISAFLLNAKEEKKSKNQRSNLIPKPDNVAVKARRKSAKSSMKHSESDGFLTLALKAKYRKSSSSIGYSMNGVEGGDGPAWEKANATWGNASWSGSGVDVRSHRRFSMPSGTSSSMQDLLRQSKTQCRSQSLLRQSSAHSLSKRNSFQSIKYANEKLDVSSLLPAKQYSKSRSSARRFSFPNPATAAAKATFSTNPLGVAQVTAHQVSHESASDMGDSLLHEACRLFPNSDTVVETALRVDPDSVRRSVVHTGDQDDNCIFGYPINLALTHGASEKILKLLVASGPDVLTFKDGTDCSASLGIALTSKTCNMATVNLLLTANDKCAQITDRRGNYPLHIAVSYGRSIDIVMRLYAVYPKAQGMRNFHSQTPLDIAIQSSRCSEDVTDFLRSVSCRSNCSVDAIDSTKQENPNHSMTSLEEGLDDIMQINY